MWFVTLVVRLSGGWFFVDSVVDLLLFYMIVVIAWVVCLLVVRGLVYFDCVCVGYLIVLVRGFLLHDIVAVAYMYLFSCGLFVLHVAVSLVVVRVLV